MCGITACIGDKNPIPILLKGLKRLEYRGYDSTYSLSTTFPFLSNMKLKVKASNGIWVEKDKSVTVEEPLIVLLCSPL
tara:strand:+ start:112 stop:345 length:234 start_codon:yes stop_codon:yes gene_type:complete